MDTKTKRRIEKTLTELDFAINAIRCINETLLINLEKQQKKLLGVYKKALHQK